MSTLIQRSFTGGEIAPKLQVRCDLTRYFTSLRTCRNSFVQKHGGVSNRAGTQFVGPTKDATKSYKLVDFIFNDDDTYSLEFGDLYMRVVKNGDYIYNAAKTITGITIANPMVITSNSHGYSNDDDIYISGIAGQLGEYLNGRFGKVVAINANTYSISFMGTTFNSTGLTAYSSGGTTEKIYSIVTPYADEDLALVQHDQSADVVTLTHPDYPIVEIARTSDSVWTLSYPDMQPDMTRPQLSLRSIAHVGAVTKYYQVTAIGEDGEESYPAWYQVNPITAVTKANPAVVTFSIPGGYGYSPAEGDLIYIEGVVGMTQLNGNIYVAKNVSGTTLELYNFDGTKVNSTGYSTWTSGGHINMDYIIGETDTMSAVNYIFLSWSWPGTRVVQNYNIYTLKNGLYGLIGVTNGNHSFFTDIGVDPDTSISPPIYSEPFSKTDDYPGALAFFQQRRIFARTNANPEKVDLSAIGFFDNFAKNKAIQDDDPFSFTLRGRKPSEIRHLLDLGKLVMMTRDSEWVANGDQGSLSPTAINAVRQSYNGSSYVPPLVIDDTAMYIQARGNAIRTLGFDYQSDGYRGNDVSIFASHLFEGYEIVDWAYQQNPHSIIWAVRNDGVLLGLTYVREQEILAWHRHDFDGGLVENVCVIPEGDEDVLYCIVKRKINGVWQKYHERMTSRFISDEEDAIVDMKFMDSHLTYDGTNTGSRTMTLSGGTLWANGEALTLTSSTAFFTAADVGNKIHLWRLNSDGEYIATKLIVEITAYTSSTVVTVIPEKDVDTDLRSVAVTTWARAVDEITGLWHLEGKAVSVFGDGYVEASPNNEDYDVLTVTNGKITMGECYAVVHVGLPFISDIETLNVDTTQSETTIDKNKLFGTLNVFVEKTNSLWGGAEEPDPDGDDPLENMQEFPTRDEDDDPELPSSLKTGKISAVIRSKWTKEGRVFLRQVDPVPMAIQAIAPSGYVPIGGR